MNKKELVLKNINAKEVLSYYKAVKDSIKRNDDDYKEVLNNFYLHEINHASKKVSLLFMDGYLLQIRSFSFLECTFGVGDLIPVESFNISIDKNSSITITQDENEIQTRNNKKALYNYLPMGEFPPITEMINRWLELKPIEGISNNFNINPKLLLSCLDDNDKALNIVYYGDNSPLRINTMNGQLRGFITPIKNKKKG